MFRWYVINTYSGHEKKVKANLEHRVETMGARQRVRQVVVPTEQVSELKDGQRVSVEKRTMPGYVLVNMEMTDDAWNLVKNTPGVTGFVGSRNKPIPLSQPEVDRLMHRETAERPRAHAQFEVGELLLGDLAHLLLGDRADLRAVRLARALVDADRLADQHRGRGRLGEEGERPVLEDGDDHGDRGAHVARRLGVERLDELHDVDAVLAQRGADRRSRGGLPARGLQLDGGEDLLRH